MSAYEFLTDCPICPQLATDRDDALGEAEALRAQLDGAKAALRALSFERRSCTPAERALIDAALAWAADMASSGRLLRLRQSCTTALAEREADQ